MVFQIITTKPTRPIQVGNLQIEFFCKKLIHTYFYEHTKTSTGYMHVATPEMTAFDLMRYMRVSGWIHHVATVLCELVSQLCPKKLLQMVAVYDVELTSAQRLGYLLDILQLQVDLEPLEQVLKIRKPIYLVLITGIKQPILEKNKRWHILVNEYVEPDEI